MLRTGSTIGFVLAAVFAGYGQQSGTSIASIESLIRSQQYDQALQLARTGLREKPGDFRLWTLEGIIFSIKGSNQEALTAFDKSLRLSPGYPAALKGEVRILYPAGDKRAIPLLNAILKADPKDETAHEMLATLDRKQGDCRGALDHFRLSSEVIQTHPDSLGAYGDCLVRTQQAEEAVPVFERLSALLPQSTYPKYDLATVLIETKQNEAAIKILDPLLDTAAPDPDVLSLASEAYEAVGNTPKAVSLLRQAIVLNPANPNYYVAFASLCLNHSSYQVGIDMLNVGLQQIHGNPALYLSRGLLYAQLAQYDKAEDDFNMVERLDSAQSLSAYALDLAEMQRNHGEQAMLKIRSQLKAHPESPWLHYVLAKLLDDQVSSTNNPNNRVSDEAIQAAQQAVKLKPDFVEARDLLAGMYMRSGQYKPAIEQSRLVLQNDPENESAMYHLIIALRRSGQNGEKDEVQNLAKRLSALQQASLHKEIERNRYKLVEQETAPAK